MIEGIVTCGCGCEKRFFQVAQYASLSGKFYYSKKCYDSLFEKCSKCDTLNLDVKEDPEKLCYNCRLEADGLIVVGLGFGGYSNNRGY